VDDAPVPNPPREIVEEVPINSTTANGTVAAASASSPPQQQQGARLSTSMAKSLRADGAAAATSATTTTTQQPSSSTTSTSATPPPVNAPVPVPGLDIKLLYPNLPQGNNTCLSLFFVLDLIDSLPFFFVAFVVACR
jgi:hypothetical protein